MGWMRFDFVNGLNCLGLPGILYDHNNQIINTVSDLALYTDYLSLPIKSFNWWNSCTQTVKSYSQLFGGWVGDNFNIYPGQGLKIRTTSECVLFLIFEQKYIKSLVCGNKYCEIDPELNGIDILSSKVVISQGDKTYISL